MRTLVILSHDNISKLAKDDLVAIHGDNEGDILVIMSEKCYEEYIKYRDGSTVNYGLKS